MNRRDFAHGFAHGFAIGAGLGAWVYPLCQYLTNRAAGRGMFDIKEN